MNQPADGKINSHEYKVGAAATGKRLDIFLAESGVPLSRRKIRQVIDVGGVYINRKRVRIASRPVVRGDVVRVEYSAQALQKLKDKRIALRPEDLIYESDSVLAINKPPGLLSQATLDQSVQHAVPALAQLLKERGDRRRRQLTLVHRLDKETSGVLLIADGNASTTWLTDQFRQRQVKKTYLALCHGQSARQEFSERAPLSAIDRKTGDVRVVQAGGRPAVTDVRVLAAFPALDLTLVECRPHTGRSHQIRVHLAKNGLPIVGDKRYVRGQRPSLPPVIASAAAEHQLLHAWAIEFKPGMDQESIRLKAPLPGTWRQILSTLAIDLE